MRSTIRKQLLGSSLQPAESEFQKGTGGSHVSSLKVPKQRFLSGLKLLGSETKLGTGSIGEKRGAETEDGGRRKRTKVPGKTQTSTMVEANTQPRQSQLLS